MSKGNKEAKKPKRVAPPVTAPIAGTTTPAPVNAFKPKPGKR